MAGKEEGRMTDRGTLGESMDERYGRYRKIIRDFTLMSDTFMRNVCREKDCVEHILQVIMGQVGLRVVESVVQSDYKNMQGRSAILDCVARDTEERRYNMEVQQKSEGAAPERARGSSGMRMPPGSPTMTMSTRPRRSMSRPICRPMARESRASSRACSSA